MLQQILQLLQQLVTWKNDVIANAKTTAELEALNPILRNALFRAYVNGDSKKISIQELIDEIASELVLGNVPVVFKLVVIDFNTPGTTQSKIIAKLNESPNYVLQQGTLYIPYVQRIVLTNGEGINSGTPGSPSYAVVTEQYFLTQRIDPDGDGISSIGTDGTPILFNGVRYFNTVDNRSLEPVDFYLGNIGTDDIWDVVNLLGPATDPVGPLSTPNGTTVLFFATQDGDERIWLYRGQQEQVGLGEPATVEDDFRLFPDEDQTDPPPTYQETKPQSLSSEVSTVTLFLHNHEGYVAGMDNAFYQAVFKTRRLKLLGYSRCLIDTTGETVYPVVENKWLVKLTGTSGTATLTIDGSDYVITYGLGLDETANAFVSANAATILSAHDLSLIYNSDGFIELDGNVSLTISIANTTGTLNGSVKTIPSVLIDSPDFEADLIYDMFTEYDGFQISYKFSPRVVNGFNGFVLKRYDDITALIADQSKQKRQAFYNVTDASDDTNITFAVGETKLQAFYEWKGTTAGTIDDYELVSAPYGNHTNTKPLVTPDTGTEITLYPFGNFCNSYVANLEDTAFTFALTNSDNPAGENATVLIKTDGAASDFPVVTDAEYVEGAPFAVDSYFDLYAWHNGAIVAYTFLRRANWVIPDWVIIPDVIGDDSIEDWHSGDISTLGYGSITVPDNDSGGGYFGLIEDFDVDFTKWSFEFKYIYIQSGGFFSLNTSNTGTGTKLNITPQLRSDNTFVLKDLSNAVQATASGLVSGDVIRFTVENGKVEIFVNNISVDSWVDVSISWTKVLSSFTIIGKGVTITDIKQIIHRS